MVPTMMSSSLATSSTHWLSSSNGLHSISMAPTMPSPSTTLRYREGKEGMYMTLCSGMFARGHGTPAGRDVSNR